MNPLLVLLAVGAGGLLLLGKKPAPKPSTVAKIPTPAGPITVTTTTPPKSSAPTSSAPSETLPTVTVPPVKVTLPTLPTDADYPTKPASGNLDPMLSQAEQYALATYSDDQLYNDGMSDGHLAYVTAIGMKLAADGDTRAADITLRIANWGK